MRKFNKSGHLQGNTTIPTYSTPYIIGAVAVDSDGCIPSLRALPTPWFREFNVTTEASSRSFILSDADTVGASGIAGDLATIVSFINNTNSGIVTTKIMAGTFMVQSTSSGDGAFLRIDRVANYPALALDLGLPTDPHSQATVHYKDLVQSAVNSLHQNNPVGTTFLAHGEDRTSSNFNRAVASVATNTDVHNAMLTAGTASLVTLRIEATSTRLITDTASNTIKGVNLSSAIQDDLTEVLKRRVAVGVLTKNSSQRDIRKFFQITDYLYREMTFGPYSLPVRVSAVVTGSGAGSNPVGPFDLDSTPSATLSDCSLIGDNKNVLSVKIPRRISSLTRVVKVLDKYTVECYAPIPFIDSLGNAIVFPGDLLEITGSLLNNRTYVIENVVSATVLELKPVSYEDVTPLDMSDTSGNISITTDGKYLRDVSLYFTERIQRPIVTELYVTIPMETAVGTIEAGGLVNSSTIEVSHWVTTHVHKRTTLSGSYAGRGTDAGYEVQIDQRPITVVSPDGRTSTATHDRNLSSARTLDLNVIELITASTYYFTEGDIGKYAKLHLNTEPSAVTNTTVLNEELVVILDILDSKRAEVARINRTTEPFAPGISISNVMLYDNYSVQFPANLLNVSYVEKSTSFSASILDVTTDQSGLQPTANMTNVELIRVAKLQEGAITGITAVTTSSNSITLSNADGTYLNSSYGTRTSIVRATPLLVHILNGPNTGWYVLNNLQDTTPATATVTSIAGDAVTFSSTSVVQYAYVYRISEGSSVLVDPLSSNDFVQKSISASSNTGDTVTALGVTWKGEGSGVVVESNAITSQDIYAGYGSSGTNIYSYAGPGSAGIYSVSRGLSSFDTTQISSTAEIAISTDQGLGSFAVEANSATYHIDLLHAPLASTHTYKGGSIKAVSSTQDPAGVFIQGTEGIDDYKVASASLVAMNYDQTSWGTKKVALGVYGDVFAPSVNNSKDPTTFYTEADMSAVSLQSSTTDSIDITNLTALNQHIIGAHSVVAYSSYTSTTVLRTRVISKSYSFFNVPHDLILEARITAGTSASALFSLPELKAAIGSLVFFTKETSGDGATAYNAILSAVDNTDHTLPFSATSNTAASTGCKLGFKIVACTSTGANSAIFALSAGSFQLAADINCPTFTSVSTLWYRPKFTANVDLAGLTRLGQGSTLDRYEFNETSTDRHRTPVLTTRELAQTTTLANLNIAQSGLQSSTRSATSITKKQMTAADSSLVKSISPTLRAFYYDSNTAPYYQKPGYEVHPSDTVVPGFSSNNLAKNGDAVTYGSHSIFVSSSLSNTVLAQNCFVAAHKDGRFRGGNNKKLVLQNNTSNLCTFTLSIKVGANIFSSSTGFSIKIVAANSWINDSFITATLKTEGTVAHILHSMTLPVDNSVPLTVRQYKEYVLEFSKDILDGCRPSTLSTDGYFVVVSFLCNAGYYDHSSTVVTNTDKLALGRGTNWEIDYNGTYPNTTYSYQASFYPDIWFIHSISVEQEKEQALITAGLDVDGTLQPRSLRLLSPVTGYQVVGPTAVDLLQNSEYGNSTGHEFLYDNANLAGTGTDLLTSTGFGRNNYNTEGRDVGLLPMWYSFYPLASELNFTHLEVSAFNIYGEHPAMYTPSGWANDSTPLYKTFYTASSGSDSGRREYTDSYTITWSNDLYDAYPTEYSNSLNLITDWYGIGVESAHSLRTNLDKFFYWSQFAIENSSTGSIFDKVGILFNAELQYIIPVTITRWYRPKFDRASFFRKGVHSAAIHGHHPYFDPMFYWLHSAQSITYAKMPIHQASNSTDPLYSASSIYDGGSYRIGKGSDYIRLIDSQVNPDAFIPSGKTGFIIPLDPPHGSRMTEVDLNLSFRPSVTRSADNVTAGDIEVGNVVSTYGVWHSMPDSSTSITNQNGEYWLGKEGWDTKEGYRVRVWRHSPFNEGTLFGEDASDSSKTISMLEKELDGNATLIHEQIVNVRVAGSSGGIGAADTLVNTVTNEVLEGISRLKIKLPTNDSFIADRSSYSYFVTVEFYIGVRKPTSLNNSAGQAVDCYLVPGLDYTKMDKFNADHFPYMWTSAFPGNRPTAMSTVYGNDSASRWEGYWTPYPNTAVLDSKWHKNTIYRRHPLNERPDYYGDDNADSSRHYSYEQASLLATPDTSNVAIDTSNAANWYLLNHSTNANSSATMTGLRADRRDGVMAVLNRGYIPDHSVWYPIVKFRGLRLSYEMDRPGHGGWGG